MNELHAAAREYARHGWPVFPLAPHSKKPFKNTHGFKDATTDEDQIDRWWREHPDANVGIATGAASGLLVLDIDPRHSGDLDQIEDEFGALPETVVSLTGGGGQHHFFRHPGGTLRCRSAILPGVDIKVDGGYVVAPPSIHDPTGREYVWEDSSGPKDVSLADPPVWLVEAARRHDREDRETEPPEMASVSLGALSLCLSVSLSQAQIITIFQATLPHDVGQRDSAVFSLARELRGVLPSADPVTLKPIVREWHRQALPIIRTKPFDETWAAFLHAWPRVKFPKGTGPFDEAVNRAQESGTPEFAMKLFVDPITHFLVRLCMELQRNAGDEPFYVSFRVASVTLGVSKDAAGRLLSMLIAERVIEVVTVGSGLKATRYRYNGDPSQRETENPTGGANVQR